MNERIEQLAVRAGATLEKGYIELSDGQFMLSDNIDLDKTNLDLEKFAELIVRECVTTLERHHPFTKDPEAYLVKG
jgi:hypothetical protein